MSIFKLENFSNILAKTIRNFLWRTRYLKMIFKTKKQKKYRFKTKLKSI